MFDIPLDGQRNGTKQIARVSLIRIICMTQIFTKLHHPKSKQSTYRMRTAQSLNTISLVDIICYISVESRYEH